MRTTAHLALLLCTLLLLQAPSNSQHQPAHAGRRQLTAGSTSSISHVLPSAHMGVHHCRLLVNGSAFGSQLSYNGTFALHVFLRYTTFNATTKVKGFASVQPLEPLPGSRKDAMLDPLVQLIAIGSDGRQGSSLTNGGATVKLRGTMQFPFVSGVVRGLPGTPTPFLLVEGKALMRPKSVGSAIPKPAHLHGVCSGLCS